MWEYQNQNTTQGQSLVRGPFSPEASTPTPTARSGSKFASFSPFFGWHKRASVTAATTPKGKKLNLRKEEGKRSPISLSLSLPLSASLPLQQRDRIARTRASTRSGSDLSFSLSPSLSLSLSKRLFLAFRIMRLRDDPLTIAIKTKASNSRP